LTREPIDYARAVAQHERYEDALRRLGCVVQRLPDAPDLPDSVFVEDTAVVFDDMAVMARPGAESRRPEVAAMATALRPHRPLVFIEAPGTLDGGDVLLTPAKVFVGISGRTNEDGVRQLAAVLAPRGIAVVSVPVSGCLHLKSAVTLTGLSPDVLPPKGGSYKNGNDAARLPPSGGRPTVVINPAWVDVGYFEGFDLIEVDPSEPAAANVLCVGSSLICADDYPQTRQRLEQRGFVTRSVPAGELAKAEGGVTCCSVILRVAGGG